MKLISYNVGCGDAFHIQYIGESGESRHIFLDMGFSRTYQIIKDEIKRLIKKTESIDALFLSHIHVDHIGGATKFIKDLSIGELPKNLVKKWVYNSPYKYKFETSNNNVGGVPCGVVYANLVYEYIYREHPLDIIDYTAGQIFDIDGMKVTILSPDTERLQQLRSKYEKGRPLCKSEDDEIGTEAGIAKNDYINKLEDFDINKFQEDTNIENSSSIAALFEYNGKRILWLADSVPSVIIDSLACLGYSEVNKLQCDIVLLSHHGSSKNNSAELFRMISSRNFLISSDGINKYALPNKETISRVVYTSSTFPIKLYFNNNNGNIPQLFKADNKEYIKSLCNVYFLDNNEVISIN